MPPAEQPARRAHFPLFLAIIFPLARIFLALSSIKQPQNFDLLRPQTIESLNHEDHKPTALVLTAHPDDEVMFFAPTILNLVKSGWDVRGLCLSTGDSEGHGETRKLELIKSYEHLRITAGNVQVIDHPDLPDSMTSAWDASVVASFVEASLKSNSADIIITFDSDGVTSHPNHISLSNSLSHLPSDLRPRIFALQSPTTLPKFTGPFYVFYLHIRALVNYPVVKDLFPVLDLGGKDEVHVMVNDLAGWMMSIRAMMAHQSQLVWFRWLYLAFSRLMWVNELVEV